MEDQIRLWNVQSQFVSELLHRLKEYGYNEDAFYVMNLSPVDHSRNIRLQGDHTSRLLSLLIKITKEFELESLIPLEEGVDSVEKTIEDSGFISFRFKVVVNEITTIVEIVLT